MSHKTLGIVSTAAALTLAMLMTPAKAADVFISLQGHKFAQGQIGLPANEAFTLTIENLDPGPAEVESKELRFEKVVKGGGKASVRIRPLTAGRYRIFDDFHESTAETFLVVK